MYNTKNYKKQGGGAWVIGGQLLPATEVQPTHVTALKTNYTTGDLDTEAEIITAINAQNVRINLIMSALEGVGIFAKS